MEITCFTQIKQNKHLKCNKLIEKKERKKNNIIKGNS